MTGKEEELPVSGVFIEMAHPSTSSSQAGSNWTREEIPIDSNNRTSVHGIFAAGDVTNVIEKQIIIAAGEDPKPPCPPTPSHFPAHVRKTQKCT